MKLSSFSEEQIVQTSREAETGEQTIGNVCCAHSISENTFYKWRKKFGVANVFTVKPMISADLYNRRLPEYDLPSSYQLGLDE